MPRFADHVAEIILGQRGSRAVLVLALTLFLGLTLAWAQRALAPTPLPAMNDVAMSTDEPAEARLVNLSTRGQVQGGDRVLIGGLIIGGDAPQKVLLRALGPALIGAVQGALTDPWLRLMDAEGQELARNDNWLEQAGRGAIQATGLAPPDEREPALLVELAPGAYTVIVEGVNDATGIALVEAYPIGASDSRLVNLSTRGPVDSGDGLLIGGFVIGGTTPKTVLIRGLGPSLAGVVPGALEDPWLELFTGGETPTRLTSNDQWQSQAATAAAVQAVGLAPPDEREAVILATLPPGPYTALLRGVDGGTGIGLVEIIEVDTSRAWLAQGSGRSRVGTGDAVAIGGFTLAGTAPKTVLIRGLGPSLGSVLRGALADPQIRLFAGDGQELAANNNWQDAQAAEILASGLAPAHPLDAAILTTLPPGSYSVILSGVDGGSGVGLLEVQELSAAPPRLISLSNRAQAQTGEQSLISGVLIQGDTLKTLVVRALGPSLAGVLNGVLGDPRLRILAADGTELAANDQWADAAGAATLQALGLAPTDPLEAALLVTLPPGAYTVQVDGANGGGLSLTDIHDTANLLHNQRPQVHAGRGQTMG